MSKKTTSNVKEPEAQASKVVVHADKQVQTTVKAPVKTAQHKTVTIKHHHAKPFRKRHVAGFTLFLLVGAVLIGLVAGHNATVREGIDAARTFISETVNPKKEVNTTVRSTYGFSLTYDARTFYASALDTQSGDLFIGSELSVNRAYELLRIAPTLTGTQEQTNSSNMTVRYYHKNAVADPTNLGALEQAALKDITTGANLQVKKTGTSNVVYGGKQFLKSEWEFQSDSKVLAGYAPSFTTYTTVHEGKAFVVETVHSPLGNVNSTLYEEVLQSLYFGPIDANALLPVTEAVIAKAQKNRGVIASALFGKIASAANAASETLTSERISSIYSPAVVKIYNFNCQDIVIEGKPRFKGACGFSTGSGFFVNPEGYVASNGHVTNSDPVDMLIEEALSGNKPLYLELLGITNITDADLPAGITDKDEVLQIVSELLYDRLESKVTSQNVTNNLLVGLAKEQPDIKELIKLTQTGKEYSEQPTIKRAKLLAQDYRTVQGITRFVTSDVAIIKIEGSNFPVTKLGSITGLLQGANLSILGYPGNANSNGLVDTVSTSATLTSGKVSAIKNALGSDKKLIETDTTIGHGNSGGPAFNDSGEVVGVSTYSIAGVNDATYNYIRDIKDLIDLAGKNSVVIESKSVTQTEWEKGLTLFNEARYSKAVKSFEKVKQQYAAHPKVDEFIAAAQENIRLGKDVKDFPMVIVVVGIVVLLGGAAAAALFIVKHKKAHNVYKAHVGAGMMQPIPQGAAPQVVSYDPAHIAAQKNVVAMHQYMQQPTTVPGAQPQPVQQPAPVQFAQPAPVQPQATPMATMPTQTVQPVQNNQQPPVPPAAG